MKSIKSLLFLAIILCSAIHLHAQKIKTYDAQWKKVDELLLKELPKSALVEVQKIYVQAKKESQEAQIIKSLVYMTNLQAENREGNDVISIQELEKEASQVKEPSTSILKSLLANRYWQYFQQHRYQLYNRTNTADFKKEDIATWTAEDLHKKISALYLQSLQNKTLLQSTKLDKFDAIITKGNTRKLRPTLYDLLAHTALNYFKNSERDIKKPSYAFEINQPEAFAPAAAFAKATFTTNDTLSLHHKALLIYQELIRFHLLDIVDKGQSALIDVDLERLQFVYQNAVMANKDDLYKQALEQLTSYWQNTSAAAQAWYLLAAYYYQLGQQYEPLKDTTNRFAIVQAKTILDRVVNEKKDKNEGWSNSYNLLQEIIRPVYRFEIEKVNVPNLPFRSLITYTNVPTLYFRIIKADSSLKKLMRNLYQDKEWETLTKMASLRQWQQSLPGTNDLQEHATEVKIDALPVGEYILLTATSNDFKKQNHLGAQFFYVSNISYINLNNQFFILNRESGQPIVNAAVQVHTHEYDYKTYNYNRQKLGDYKTDKNGFVEVANRKEKQDPSYFLDIKTATDFLSLDEQLYHTYYYDQRKEKPVTKQVFYFTDRSLYRPGQTVYVKGIVITKQGKNNTIAPNYTTTIYLRNANTENIDSLTVTTNAFGSFNGKFNLPQNLLNGEFSIREKDGNGEAEFAVEEYKRPKFYVDFEKVKDTYKAGDSVTVIGFAKAYAGINIDGAKVAYRVVRQPRFIYPWLTRRWWLPRAEPMEIAHGETTTDKDGKFIVRFTAIPDKKIDRKLEPVFDYRIYTDITDQNGETRSGQNIVSAGYKSLLLTVYTPEKIAADSLRSIQVQAKNMNGEYQPATVTLNITKLTPEQRLIRKRYWKQPDQFVMSKEEYISLFPYDEYSNESERTSWAKGEMVYSRTDSTRIIGEWPLPNVQLRPGHYQFEFTTKDKEGQEVKDIHYVEVFDSKTRELAKPDYLWTIGTNAIEPGEKTAVQLGTTAKEVYIIQAIDKTKEEQESKLTYTYSTLNNEKKAIDFTASEADRGGYGVSFFFVKHNRFYQHNETVFVPWSNKELSISYSTFRDKLLPGSQEKWQVKISGYKGDKAAAEVLASMYDASLDQFKPHSWSTPSIWPTYSRTELWQAGQNFAAVSSQIKWVNDRDYQSYYKQYDRFNFEEDYVSNYNTRRRAAKAAGIQAESERQRKSIPTTDAAAPMMDQVQEVAIMANGKTKEEADAQEQDTANVTSENNAIQIRKNLNETAFFFPDLHTDSAGNISFSFTTPEALTRWKLQTLSHTKELAFGRLEKEVVTQKELMVQPNAPRFLRQGDRLEFTAKVVNLTGKELTGQAELQLVDAATNTSVDGWFQNMFPNQYFTVAPGQSEVVKFPIEVPFTFNSALAWRVVARAGNFSDGEEAAIPVLTNKMLVTETLPLPMRGTGSKNFTFDKLLKTNSETLQHQNLAVEYTANPAWFAVQALPYLMEQECEHTEQIWNRYYANALAMKIMKDAPRVKQIMEQWKTIDTSALLSNLQKNEELKSALLEETPWVLQAKSETQQKKNIALLFDLVHMSSEQQTTLQKLKEMQSANGGFVWIKGAPEDRYMTQYILTGIGHLHQLGAISLNMGTELHNMVSAALPYLDMKLKQDYDRLIKGKANLKIQPCDPLQAQYLYMRSMLKEYPIDKAAQTAYNYYRKQAQAHWTKTTKFSQGMIALALHRTGDKKTPGAILKSLKERALVNEEMGMYWKDNSFGYSWLWYHAPIETQSMLIEAFSEITNDTQAVDDMRTWLIKNKQTNNWHTTKATADACYAMLLQGSEWLTSDPVVTVQLGSTTISSQGDNRAEAGTGYFKKSIEPQFIKADMGNITVTVNPTKHTGASQPVNAPSWGAVYWQYFEDLDKITSAATPLKLSKKLFIEKNTDRSPVLSPIAEGTPVAVGDKIKVRVELRVDRDMEYVHMKDMRSSGLEPENVLSGYKWQGGLGYYETTKDASTSFFFPYLQKGTYVFEYPLFVTHTGNFSNGITTIQCLYAPEFAAHSEGVRLIVE